MVCSLFPRLGRAYSMHAIPDAAMKVSIDILRRVYDALQDQGDRINEGSKETLDPDSHLYVVDAFDMPLWHWSGERGTFEKSVMKNLSNIYVICSLPTLEPPPL